MSDTISSNLSQIRTAIHHGKRVLIMSASAGSGHIQAASALERSFAADPRVAEVINNDALQYTNKLFRTFYSKFYDSLVKSAPNFLGWWYKTSDEPWRTDAMRSMIDRLNTKPLVKFIRAFDPHITVCTHYMPAGIISHLIATRVLNAHLSIVVTDFDFHAMWLSRAFHRYFVALDETQAFLETLGLPSERITVSGIPINPDFDLSVDKAEECWRLGLNPDRPILLLSAGAMGSEPTAYMVERLMTLMPRAQLVVVCGRNEILRRHILRMTRHLSDHIKVLGYCNEMYKLMRIADILIAKPGGLTASEALVTGIPLCIVNPIPGQEERNSDHLLEAGVAVKCHDLNTLSFKVERLLNRPEQLSDMRIRALRFAKPDAAKTIVDTLLSDELPPLALSRKERMAMTQSALMNDF